MGFEPTLMVITFLHIWNFYWFSKTQSSMLVPFLNTQCRSILLMNYSQCITSTSEAEIISSRNADNWGYKIFLTLFYLEVNNIYSNYAKHIQIQPSTFSITMIMPRCNSTFCFKLSLPVVLYVLILAKKKLLKYVVRIIWAHPWSKYTG